VETPVEGLVAAASEERLESGEIARPGRANLDVAAG
jgi:hypothetical protein